VTTEPGGAGFDELQGMSLEVDLDLEGRVAVVSGGSRGIGRATALRLAGAGAHVVINYVRDSEAAEETARGVSGAGRKALIVKADVSRPEGAEEVVRATTEAFGRLDVLVCNAGIWEGAAVEEMSEELWGRVVDTNLKGTWALCRAATPELKRAGFGRVVIVSSTAGQRGEAFYTGYAASKGGQIAFTKSLAAELAPYGINVNAVAPGWVETEMTAHVLEGRASRAEIEGSIPLGRVASADEVALPILFLCSGWARHITGEVLNVNGGSVLCG
jgi:3-oxoacyl-[acyl-carrier protein] reductase